MSTEIEQMRSPSIALAKSAADQMQRYGRFLDAMAKVPDPRFPKPVPRFLTELPYLGDDDEIAERIIAKMMSAENPYEVTDAGETLSGKSLIGQAITVNDIRVNPSTLEGGWAAYLVCDVTMVRTGDRDIMTIGAKQAVMKLAYAYVSGDFPVAGHLTVVTTTGKGRPVIDFIVEMPFDTEQKPPAGEPE